MNKYTLQIINQTGDIPFSEVTVIADYFCTFASGYYQFVVRTSQTNTEIVSCYPIKFTIIKKIEKC
mgnify:CR=1 FL=1